MWVSRTKLQWRLKAMPMDKSYSSIILRYQRIGRSGVSVSSKDGIPVWKSISFGFHTDVRLRTFQKMYRQTNMGILISVNHISALSIGSMFNQHEDKSSPMSNVVDLKNWRKPVSAINTIDQISPYMAKYGCQLLWYTSIWRSMPCFRIPRSDKYY